jgi:hypothetical protein
LRRKWGSWRRGNGGIRLSLSKPHEAAEIDHGSSQSPRARDDFPIPPSIATYDIYIRSEHAYNKDGDPLSALPADGPCDLSFSRSQPATRDQLLPAPSLPFPSLQPSQQSRPFPVFSSSSQSLPSFTAHSSWFVNLVRSLRPFASIHTTSKSCHSLNGSAKMKGGLSFPFYSFLGS